MLVATDVLSEGQNLQDAFIVVNYDLPVGDYPIDSAGGSCGPHRATGGGDSLLLVPARRRCGEDHQTAVTGP